MAPSVGASRHKCDQLLYVLMGGANTLPRGLYAEPHPPLTPKVHPSPASQSSHPPLLMFYQAAFATLAERRETEKQKISEKVQSIPASRNA